MPIIDLDALAEALAPRVAALLSAPAPALVDQRQSPLGPRRHAALCRRLMAAGDARASKVGRRWLVTQDAIAEELARLGRAAPPSTAPATDDDLDAVAKRLGITTK